MYFKEVPLSILEAQKKHRRSAPVEDRALCVNHWLHSRGIGGTCKHTFSRSTLRLLLAALSRMYSIRHSALYVSH
jgi:hypothetical protein